MSTPDPAAVWPKGRLVAHPQPGKVWVEVPHRNDISSDWIEADAADLLAAARTERAPEADGRGNWMQTFTGCQFYPMDPRPEEMHAEDIAHALGNICRYGGHVDRFYSVAEHCVLMSHAVEPQHSLWALLHDATEAYVGDMVRPLKQHMPDYVAVEDRLMSVVADRFGLVGPMPAAVKEADARILLDERAALMSRTRWPWAIEHLEPLGVTIHAWSPTEAAVAWLTRLNDLLATHPAPEPQQAEADRAGGERGLEARYRVEKINDPTGKHAHCRYFVLDPQHDPLALDALDYYALLATEKFPALANDLDRWVQSERNKVVE